MRWPEGRGRTRWPAGLIGSLALCTVVERAIEQRPHDFQSTMQWDWKLTRDAASEVGDAQVICLGDSLSKEGILPPVLEGRLGVRVQTLALNAGHPSAHLALFRRARASGGNPRAVLIEMEPWLMAAGFAYNRPNWPVLLGAGEAVGLSRRMRDAGFLAWWAVAQLPSVRGRDELRRVSLSTLKGEPPANRLGTPALVRNWRANGGAQVFEETARFDGRLTDDHHQWFPIELRADAAAKADLGPLFDELTAGGRRVFWLLPPIARAARAKREVDGLDDRHDRMVDSIAAAYPGVVVLDGRRLDLPDESFHDPFHLNRSGATELSTRVGEAIATVRPAIRRVDLRDVATGPVGETPALETLAESRRILAERIRR